MKSPASSVTACLAFGRSHGDWAPQNIGEHDGRVVVWDWERMTDCAPIGIDLAHYVGETGQTEALAGCDAGDMSLLALLDTFDRAVRHRESPQVMHPEVVKRRAALISELERRLAGLPVTSAPAPLLARKMQGGIGAPVVARRAVRRAASIWLRGTASTRPLPNWLIVGTQRGGTTSLFRYLIGCNGVAGPVMAKGVHYFDTNPHQSESWYRSHFPRWAGAVGEASPYYLFHPDVPARIADLLPGGPSGRRTAGSGRARSVTSRP